jgi:hypothetical protein
VARRSHGPRRVVTRSSLPGCFASQSVLHDQRNDSKKDITTTNAPRLGQELGQVQVQVLVLALAQQQPHEPGREKVREQEREQQLQQKKRREQERQRQRQHHHHQ